MTGHVTKVDLRRSHRGDPLVVRLSGELVAQLVTRRQQRGLTQQQLAERLGTSQRTISQLERRTQDPKVSTLIEWALALGLRPRIETAAAAGAATG